MRTIAKPKMTLYVILLAVVVGAMVMLKNCNDTTPIDKYFTSKGDTIDVAIEYSPLSCYMYDDTLGGFNYDLLRLIALKGNITIKFHPIVTLQSSLEDLRNGKYKILAAQLPVTSEYKKNYLFTDPIFLDKQVLVQRKDSISGKVKIKTQLDFAEKKINIIAGSPMAERLSNLSREIGDTIYISAEKNYGPEQLFIMVATGEIEYAVINEKIARSLAKDYSQVSVDTDVSFTQFQSWALNHSNKALCDSINSWLKQVKGTTEYNSLLNRYLK